MKIKFFDDVKEVFGDSGYLTLEEVVEPRLKEHKEKWANVPNNHESLEHWRERLSIILNSFEEMSLHNRDVSAKKEALMWSVIARFWGALFICFILFILWQSYMARHSV